MDNSGSHTNDSCPQKHLATCLEDDELLSTLFQKRQRSEFSCEPSLLKDCCSDNNSVSGLSEQSDKMILQKDKINLLCERNILPISRCYCHEKRILLQQSDRNCRQSTDSVLTNSQHLPSEETLLPHVQFPTAASHGGLQDKMISEEDKMNLPSGPSVLPFTRCYCHEKRIFSQQPDGNLQETTASVLANSQQHPSGETLLPRVQLPTAASHGELQEKQTPLKSVVMVLRTGVSELACKTDSLNQIQLDHTSNSDILNSNYSANRNEALVPPELSSTTDQKNVMEVRPHMASFLPDKSLISDPTTENQPTKLGDVVITLDTSANIVKSTSVLELTHAIGNEPYNKHVVPMEPTYCVNTAEIVIPFANMTDDKTALTLDPSCSPSQRIQEKMPRDQKRPSFICDNVSSLKDQAVVKCVKHAPPKKDLGLTTEKSPSPKVRADMKARQEYAAMLEKITEELKKDDFIKTPGTGTVPAEVVEVVEKLTEELKEDVFFKTYSIADVPVGMVEVPKGEYGLKENLLGSAEEKLPFSQEARSKSQEQAKDPVGAVEILEKVSDLKECLLGSTEKKSPLPQETHSVSPTQAGLPFGVYVVPKGKPDLEESPLGLLGETSMLPQGTRPVYSNSNLKAKLDRPTEQGVLDGKCALKKSSDPNQPCVCAADPLPSTSHVNNKHLIPDVMFTSQQDQLDLTDGAKTVDIALHPVTPSMTKQMDLTTKKLTEQPFSPMDKNKKSVVKRSTLKGQSPLLSMVEVQGADRSSLRRLPAKHQLIKAKKRKETSIKLCLLEEEVEPICSETAVAEISPTFTVEYCSLLKNHLELPDPHNLIMKYRPNLYDRKTLWLMHRYYEENYEALQRFRQSCGRQLLQGDKANLHEIKSDRHHEGFRLQKEKNSEHDDDHSPLKSQTNFPAANQICAKIHQGHSDKFDATPGTSAKIPNFAALQTPKIEYSTDPLNLLAATDVHNTGFSSKDKFSVPEQNCYYMEHKVHPILSEDRESLKTCPADLREGNVLLQEEKCGATRLGKDKAPLAPDSLLDKCKDLTDFSTKSALAENDRPALLHDGTLQLKQQQPTSSNMPNNDLKKNYSSRSFLNALFDLPTEKNHFPKEGICGATSKCNSLRGSTLVLEMEDLSCNERLKKCDQSYRSREALPGERPVLTNIANIVTDKLPLMEDPETCASLQVASVVPGDNFWKEHLHYLSSFTDLFLGTDSGKSPSSKITKCLPSESATCQLMKYMPGFSNDPLLKNRINLNNTNFLQPKQQDDKVGHFLKTDDEASLPDNETDLLEVQISCNKVFLQKGKTESSSKDYVGLKDDDLIMEGKNKPTLAPSRVTLLWEDGTQSQDYPTFAQNDAEKSNKGKALLPRRHYGLYDDTSFFAEVQTELKNDTTVKSKDTLVTPNDDSTLPSHNPSQFENLCKASASVTEAKEVHVTYNCSCLVNQCTCPLREIRMEWNNTDSHFLLPNCLPHFPDDKILNISSEQATVFDHSITELQTVHSGVPVTTPIVDLPRISESCSSAVFCLDGQDSRITLKEPLASCSSTSFYLGGSNSLDFSPSSSITSQLDSEEFYANLFVSLDDLNESSECQYLNEEEACFWNYINLPKEEPVPMSEVKNNLSSNDTEPHVELSRLFGNPLFVNLFTGSQPNNSVLKDESQYSNDQGFIHGSEIDTPQHHNQTRSSGATAGKNDWEVLGKHPSNCCLQEQFPNNENVLKYESQYANDQVFIHEADVPQYHSETPLAGATTVGKDFKVMDQQPINYTCQEQLRIVSEPNNILTNQNMPKYYPQYSNDQYFIHGLENDISQHHERYLQIPGTVDENDLTLQDKHSANYGFQKHLLAKSETSNLLTNTNVGFVTTECVTIDKGPAMCSNENLFLKPATSSFEQQFWSTKFPAEIIEGDNLLQRYMSDMPEETPELTSVDSFHSSHTVTLYDEARYLLKYKLEEMDTKRLLPPVSDENLLNEQQTRLFADDDSVMSYGQVSPERHFLPIYCLESPVNCNNMLTKYEPALASNEYSWLQHYKRKYSKGKNSPPQKK